MSHSLYEEAIAEARRLREMAEENAKNKIIDAVTPQIRNLIEQELMGAPEAPVEDMLSLDDEEDVSYEVPDAPEGDEVIDLDSLMSPAPEGKDEEGVSFTVDDDGEVEIEIGGTKVEIEPGAGMEDDDEILLDKQVAEALASMIASSGSGRKKLNEKVSLLERKMGVLKRALLVAKSQGNSSQRKKVATIFESLAREAVALRNQVMITENNSGSKIPERNIVNSIIKEMKQMSRKNNRSIFDFLFEAEEGEEMSDLELDSAEGDEEMEMKDEEVDVDLDAAEDAVLDLTAALGLDMGGEEEGEEMDMELDLEDEEDLEEGDYMMGEEEVYEIDENVLRQELARMRRLQEGDPVEQAPHFGGGDAGDEPFIEVDEETLINALADELGDAPRPTQMSETYRRRSAYRSQRRRSSRTMKESRQSRHGWSQRSSDHDYRKVAKKLQGQLVEMNLFNAKLLYANKLMQNKNLTAKQERAIVEALDNAKTLREAKLLYKSLSKSFGKGAKKTLREGKSLRTRGSASKSARSAQPNSSAGSTDRWAVLAGIKQDN